MQPLRSKYAIIIFIYMATTLPPQQTYRTHSPKLGLLLVLLYFPFVNGRCHLTQSMPPWGAKP